MKKTILVLFMAATAAVIFASGSQEKNNDGVIELQPGPRSAYNYTEGQEEVELKGQVKFESPVPELVSGGKTYSLFAPGAMAFYGYLEEGDDITVSGYLLDEDAAASCMSGFGRRGPNAMFSDDEVAMDNVIWVETVEMDGETYQLPQMGQMGDDYGYGMRGGRMDGFGDDDRRAPKAGGRGRNF